MWIHHLTHIENLENILEKGLKPRNKLNQNEFRNTANDEIINKREKYQSNNDNNKIKNFLGEVNMKKIIANLNNYIPFHINELHKKYGIPYNYAVCKKEGNKNMIILSCKTENLLFKEIVYQLYHPVSNYKCEYITNNEEKFIKKFKKEERKLKNEYNFDYSNQRVKEFLMSEILVKGILYLDNKWKIYVYSDEIKNKIENCIGNKKIDVIVNSSIFS